MILSRHAIEWTVTLTRGLAHEFGTTDFGIRDEKGRAVGFQVHITEEVPIAEAEKASRHIPQTWQDEASLGRPWRLSFRATRNGVGFGASNPSRHFAHELDARAAAETIASETHRRYAKKYAR